MRRKGASRMKMVTARMVWNRSKLVFQSYKAKDLIPLSWTRPWLHHRQATAAPLHHPSLFSPVLVSSSAHRAETWYLMEGRWICCFTTKILDDHWRNKNVCRGLLPNGKNTPPKIKQQKIIHETRHEYVCVFNPRIFMKWIISTKIHNIFETKYHKCFC